MDSGDQDQSIKDRKNLLYEDDAPPPGPARPPSKPFDVYLRETPAAPLSPGIKAAIWAAGAVVALLLAGAAMKPSPPKSAPKAKARRAKAEAQIERSNPSNLPPRVLIG